MTDTQTRPSRAQLRGPLQRYQILSYLTSLGLIVLLFVAMPLKYFAHNATVIGLVGPAHGLVYMVYLLCVFDLGNKVGWPLKRTILVMLAGVIPLASIFVERAVHRRILAEATD
jgi:integral membrane protein